MPYRESTFGCLRALQIVTSRWNRYKLQWHNWIIAFGVVTYSLYFWVVCKGPWEPHCDLNKYQYEYTSRLIIKIDELVPYLTTDLKILQYEAPKKSDVECYLPLYTSFEAPLATTSAVLTVTCPVTRNKEQLTGYYCEEEEQILQSVSGGSLSVFSCNSHNPSRKDCSCLGCKDGSINS